MTWFKENKFLAGILVLTLGGGGFLVWKMIEANGKYSRSVEAFQTQATELKRLETAPAYPDKRNLDALEEQRLKHLTMISDLQKSLAAAEMPLDPIAPTQFQDQLKTAVTQYVGKAAKIALPKGFYYGFEPYATTLPNQDVAPLLSRELKAIQLLFDTLLTKGKGRVTSVVSFSRETMAEESNKKPVEPPPSAKPKKPGDKPAAAPVDPLVKSHFVDLVFVAEQSAVAEILNEYASNKQQYFIIRYVALHNSTDRPPNREAASVVAATPAPGSEAPPPPAEPVPGAPEVVKDPIILGNEKLEVTLRIEIVDFAEPKVEAAPAPKVNRNAGK